MKTKEILLNEKRLRKSSYKEFDKWYGEYFCDQQGEDNPYRYIDVKIAFLVGWKRGKNKYGK